MAEVDVQSDAITLWIDCEQPRNVRVKRYEGTTDVPTTFADMLRPDRRDREPTAVLPPAVEQCPHCFGEIDKGADICPHCGHYLGEKPKRSKKFWIILALLLLLLLLLIVGVILLLTGDEKDPAPKPTPTASATAEASAEPTANPLRRITGPGWEGRAPRSFKISGVDRQSGGQLPAPAPCAAKTGSLPPHLPHAGGGREPGHLPRRRPQAAGVQRGGVERRDREELRRSRVREPQLLGPAAQRPGLGRHRDHRQRHPGRAPGRGEGDRGVDKTR